MTRKLFLPELMPTIPPGYEEQAQLARRVGSLIRGVRARIPSDAEGLPDADPRLLSRLVNHQALLLVIDCLVKTMPGVPLNLGRFNPPAGLVEHMHLLLGLPRDTTVPQALAAVDENHDRYVDLLVTITEQIASRTLSEFRDALVFDPSWDTDELETELDITGNRLPAAAIPFVPAQNVSVSDWRASPRAPAPSIDPAPRPTPAPAPDTHRERADRLAAELAALQSRQARKDQRAADEDSSSEQWRELARGFKARIRILEQRIDALSGPATTTPAAVSLPDSWDRLQDFADEHLTGRVVLTGKALRAARRSHFANIPFAYDVMLMLARDYVPMRLGEPGARTRFEESCARLRVEVGPTGFASISHQTRKTYQVNHLGTSLTADLHVKGSSSRDPREGFRLYFAWVDDDGGSVVVVSMPSHLDNGQS